MQNSNKKKNNNKKRIIPQISTKTTLIFIIIFILGLIGVGLVYIYVSKATGLTFTEDTYQYYGSGLSKHEKGSSLVNSKMSTIVLGSDKEEYGLDATPIYSYDKHTIYLPKSYCYCCTEDGTYWRIPEFAKLVKDANSNIITCIYNGNEIELSNGYLFDGGNNYIFFENGKVLINDFDIYEVSPFSFFSSDHNCLRVYNLNTDDYMAINETTTNAIFDSSSGYVVDMYRGIYTNTSHDKTLLISSPTLLEPIDKRGE